MTGTPPLPKSEAEIDISGVQLWDPGIGNWFTFPGGSVLPAGGYAVVITNVGAGGNLLDADLSFSAGRGQALLNNTGDNIIALDPAANEFIVSAYGNWDPIDPRNPVGAGGGTQGLDAFPDSSTQSGAGEQFGPLIAGQAIQRVPNGGDTFVNDLAPTPGEMNLCFVSGTMVATSAGLRPVENLKVDDMVRTLDGSYRPVRWVGLKRIRASMIAEQIRHWPVTFAAGSLGAGLPCRAISLSPQHRVLVAGSIALRLFGASEVLVPAKAFLGLPGVVQDQPRRDFLYVHFMCDQHEIVVAEGIAAETLFLGPMALNSLGPESLAEIREIFPEMQTEPVRPMIKAGRARALIGCHIGRDQPLQVPGAPD